MENYMVTNINNDFLLQSYSQNIERIAGTKDHIFNFQIPKKLLEVREKAWTNLFDKYSKKMSNNIELNIDTLEPVEKEIDKKVSEEEYSYEQRRPMRKSATLIQYWINTGNQPYKVLLDEDELSETGASLSEKEITLSLHSSISNIINESNKQEYKSESSYSSVNTAAYILSNANITNKADAIAIMESAQYGIDINSSKHIYIKDVKVNNKIQCIENANINCATHNDNSNVNNVPDIEVCSMKEYIASKTSDQLTTNVVTSGNTIQSNIYLQCCEETDKMNMSRISQSSLNTQSVSKDNIIRQFDKTLKQLTARENNDALNEDEIFEKNTSHEKSENIAQESITKDTNLTTFYRKKLYTGRNSPVDLIQIKRHSISKLSEAKQSLHPALHSDCTIKKETLLVHKDKSKNLFSFDKTNGGFKKMKGKRKRSISDKNISDDNNSNKLLNNNGIQNDIIDGSFKISSDYNNSDKRDYILLSGHNNTTIFVRNEPRCKQDLASLNINPVVLLERITPSFKQHEFKSAKKNHIAQKSNVHNHRHLNQSNKLCVCEIENVELGAVDSDESTILCVCNQCKVNAQDSASFTEESNYSLNLKLSIENKFSASNMDEKNDKLSRENLKNIDVSQNKEACTTRLKELSPHLSVNEDYTNVRFGEIKIMMERLSSSTIKSQILNEDNTVPQKKVLNKSETLSLSGANKKIDNVRSREIKIILERLPESIDKNFTNRTVESEILNKNDIQQKEILNKFKTHSNLNEINKIDNVKPREIKIVLKRLSSNICFNDTNIFADKNIISENTNSHNNKRGIGKMSKISACENIEASIRTIDKIDNNYSFKMHDKSKKYNPIINDTSDIDEEHQVFDKVEPKFSIQHKIDNKVSQNKRYKCSVSTSSDEDDFAGIITQRQDSDPKKRLKSSISDKLLDETNISEKDLCEETKFITTDEDKYHCNAYKNRRTVVFSSEKLKATKKTSKPIKKKKGSSRVEIKSFDNTSISLKMSENEKFLDTPNENYNDSVTKNLDKRERTSFLNYNKSNERRSNAIVKRNRIDYNDLTNGIFFQTKTFYSDSSSSQENNYDTSSSQENNYDTTATRKAFKNSRVHHTKKVFSHISLGKNNFSSFSKNKQISDKSSAAIQQDDLKSTKLLMFQTKTYYDSDSNESL